jgi:adenylate cyclase
MALTRSRLRTLRIIAIVVVAGAVAGGAFGLSQNSGTPALALAVGMSIGALIACVLTAFELILVPRMLGRGPSRMSFTKVLLMRTGVYAVVIVATLLLVPWLVMGVKPLEDPTLPVSIAFSFGASLIANFTVSITRLIGPRVLGNFLTGRYHHPREERLILMFLDLTSSTTLAERLGNVRFHELLAEVFDRLSEAVTDSGGDVYEYVGDEMVATWPVRDPAHNARALTCFFDCVDAIAAAREGFERRYGCVPRFRAGLHLGTIVAGEIGGFKQEIAYSGDAMNTTARIEEACRELQEPLLVSKALLDAVLLPPGFAAVSVGVRTLRGKEARLELFAVRRNHEVVG